MKNFDSFLSPLPRVFAHRGDSANYPENTLSAFLSAVEMKVDVIETDVHLTKDKSIVIWHDPTLDRNTNGKGRIEDYTLSELKTFDAGYTFTKDGGKTFPFRGKGITLCSLEEALLACPDMRFNIDLKSEEKEIAEVFVKIIKKNEAEKRICTASFHLENLRNVRKLCPEILTSLTGKEVGPKSFFKFFYSNKRVKKPTVFQVPLKKGAFKIITPFFITKWHKKGAVIMVWTINDESEMKRLFLLGVDSIMTDKPRLLLNVVKELRLEPKE